MQIIEFKNFFYVDSLSLVMLTLISFVTSIAYSFSTRYMKGDSVYSLFLLRLIKIAFFASLMVLSNNLVLFFITWNLSNIVLVKLMIHKSSWKSAFCSGILAGKNFILGAIFLFFGFGILYWDTGKLSINAISGSNISHFSLLIAQIFLLLAAMTQSAIWPFHKWLISSLNSPTPVSAIMHAGLINGGGFLLMRFSFLYINSPNVLLLIFIIGLTTACIGTTWKLMQHDIKRMLACSTMGQMGFMFAQCGLGLFSSAIIHLCLHGLFKAYLFLGSGDAAKEKQIELKYPPRCSAFFISLLAGLIGCYGFAHMSVHDYSLFDTSLMTLFLVWIVCCQFMLSLMFEELSLKKIISFFIIVFILGCIYGAMICFLDGLLESLNLVHPQPLNIIHLLGMALLLFGWLCILFTKKFNSLTATPEWMLCLYVKILNASQPDDRTVTNNRNDYTYLK
ncbi:MAG: proton-conducting transporter membrane subunit [Candidatus Dependentiae bacterium]|nr:proton-conducting transporter membrane subunit [Candidatus Dependentiae bacterium]